MMTNACIVVADASRARLFTLDDRELAAGRPGLIEREDLISAGRRLKPSEALDSDRPSLGRTRDGRGYAVDDVRQHMHDEQDHAFAERIVETVRELVTTEKLPRVVLVAAPHMLGLLRHGADELARRGIAVEEYPADQVRSSPAELQDRLAVQGLVPQRPRLGRD